jgi:tetratricopeptide (TPR) repeat protein
VKTLWALVGASLLLGGGAVHAGPVEDALAAAMEDVEGGRCVQAVDRLSRIDGLASRALLVGGRCRVDQGQYAEALSDFDGALEAGGLSSGQLGELELHRAVALFHLERFGEAEAALDRAEGRTTDEAQLALYRGMIALRRDENERAASHLESAARLGPVATEPVASYYAGLAWQGAAERTKAREAFKRVVELDPDGPWGREAAKLLDSTELFPFFLRVSTGFEYDDNVLLRATGTDRVTSNGDKDWLGVWEVEGGVQLFAKGPWAGGLLGSYSGSRHHDLTDFDVHFPNIGPFLDYRFGPSTISQLRYNFGHAWVNENAFVRNQSVVASLAHTWERAGTTETSTDVAWNDFRFNNVDVPDGVGTPGVACPRPVRNGVTGCGPPGIREAVERDQDGYGLGATIEHLYPVDVPDSIAGFLETLVVRGAYRFEYYNSQGKEWDRFENSLSAGFTIELPFDVSFDGSAAYEHYDYLHRSTYPDNEIVDLEYALDLDDRDENAFLVEAEIEKDFNDYFSVSGRYMYYDSSSNRRVYDYRRHIVGGYVNFRFD